MARKMHPAYWTVGVNIQMAMGDDQFPNDILNIILEYFGELKYYTFEWNTDSDDLHPTIRNDRIYQNKRDAKINGLLYMIDEYQHIEADREELTERFFNYLINYDHGSDICGIKCPDCQLFIFVSTLSDDELEQLYQSIRTTLPKKPDCEERLMRIIDLEIIK